MRTNNENELLDIFVLYDHGAKVEALRRYAKLKERMGYKITSVSSLLVELRREYEKFTGKSQKY